MPIFEETGPELILVIAQPRVIPSRAAVSHHHLIQACVAGLPVGYPARRAGLFFPAHSLRPLQFPSHAGVGSSFESPEPPRRRTYVCVCSLEVFLLTSSGFEPRIMRFCTASLP